MKFNEQTDGWFDAVTDWAVAHPEDKAILLGILKLRPRKENVKRFQAMLYKVMGKYLPGESRYHVQHSMALALFNQHCLAVLHKAFKSEFRYSFGDATDAESFTTHFIKCSAASEFFNSARQALSYFD